MFIYYTINLTLLKIFLNSLNLIFDDKTEYTESYEGVKKVK